MDEVKPMPNKIALVTGDVLQNLRSALDHLAYQLYLNRPIALGHILSPRLGFNGEKLIHERHDPVGA
jgi:hypothetical protein